MNSAETAMEFRKAGYAVHKSGGVWWRREMLGFCKPVDFLQTVQPGASSPSYFRSIVGYSHCVPPESSANHSWEIMLLRSDALQEFDVGQMKPRKRSVIRKALRELEIRTFQVNDAVIEDMNAICVSAAERTDYGNPPSYYVESRGKWENEVRRQFAMRGREYWGVFASGRLIAYYVGTLIAGTMYIGSAKSHSEFLKLHPNDALAFSFLEHCRGIDECRQVVFGSYTPGVPSLNKFKEQYGFERTPIPVYRKERLLFRIACAVRKLRAR